MSEYTYGEMALFMAGVMAAVWFIGICWELLCQKVDEEEPDEHEIFPGL